MVEIEKPIILNPRSDDAEERVQSQIKALARATSEGVKKYVDGVVERIERNQRRIISEKVETQSAGVWSRFLAATAAVERRVTRSEDAIAALQRENVVLRSELAGLRSELAAIKGKVVMTHDDDVVVNLQRQIDELRNMFADRAFVADWNGDENRGRLALIEDRVDDLEMARTRPHLLSEMELADIDAQFGAALLVELLRDDARR